jgi:hypothetical protein
VRSLSGFSMRGRPVRTQPSSLSHRAPAETELPAASWVAKRRLVICGSITFYGQMQRAAETLRASAVKSVLPDPDDSLPASATQEQADIFKRELSFAHLRRIRNPVTFAILVLNFDKFAIPDYIGPSTFAEIAVAAVSGKRIYLIGDYPEVYSDELSAWQAVRLGGRLDALIGDYWRECVRPSPQMNLFAGS